MRTHGRVRLADADFDRSIIFIAVVWRSFNWTNVARNQSIPSASHNRAKLKGRLCGPVSPIKRIKEESEVEWNLVRTSEPVDAIVPRKRIYGIRTGGEERELYSN